MVDHSVVDDDDEKPDEKARSYKEFDCPSCTANNPTDPPFSDGDELLCNYCGAQFKVRIGDDGRARFKEI